MFLIYLISLKWFKLNQHLGHKLIGFLVTQQITRLSIELQKHFSYDYSPHLKTLHKTNFATKKIQVTTDVFTQLKMYFLKRHSKNSSLMNCKLQISTLNCWNFQLKSITNEEKKIKVYLFEVKKEVHRFE